MEGEDEVLFVGKFKDLDVGVRFSVAEKGETDVVFALATINEKIEGAAFKFSGIDCEKIKKILNEMNGSGIAAIISFLESKKPNELRSALSEASKDELLIPVAETYLFNQLFEKAGIPYKIKPEMLTSELKPETEKPEDQIVFVGKYKGWISIKKLSIDNKTEDWEVSATLSAINNTLMNKVFNFAKASGTAMMGSGRKSYANVSEALKKFAPTGNPINDAFTINKTMEAIGYKPYAHPEMLSLAHPEVKAVKMRGRKAKG